MDRDSIVISLDDCAPITALKSRAWRPGLLSQPYITIFFLTILHSLCVKYTVLVKIHAC